MTIITTDEFVVKAVVASMRQPNELKLVDTSVLVYDDQDEPYNDGPHALWRWKGKAVAIYYPEVARLYVNVPDFWFSDEPVPSEILKRLKENTH